MSNESSAHNSSCITTYSSKIFLNEDQRTFLVIFDILIMFCNLISNGLVAVLINLTKQLNNTSFYLIFFLSVSDICLGFTVQPMFAVMLYAYSKDTYCTFETILEFFAILFTHTSGYCIAVIAFDRYCRMKYLNRYLKIMTKWITNIVFVLIISFSLVQASVYVVGTQINFFQHAKSIAIGIDACIAISVVVVYVLTVRVVRHHRRNAVSKDILLTVDRVVTKIAARISLAVVIFYLPYIITSWLYARFDGLVNKEVQRWLGFMVFLGFLLTYCNTTANAVIFLTLNKKGKRKILEITNYKKRSSPQLDTRIVEIQSQAE